MVEYWHWHSLHNGCETYWKGLLSHDFKENDTYRAAMVIGNEFARIGSHLVNLEKHNRVAVLVSNEALTALEWFPIGGGLTYNDVVRSVYDQLYRMNVECDIVWPDTEDFSSYDLLVVPALYAAPEALLWQIDEYVKNGGHLFATFKTAFADEHIKAFSDEHPHILSRCLGVTYSHFTYPKNVQLIGHAFCPENEALYFMELLEPGTAQVLAEYDQDYWKRYAAVTRNRYGAGSATYLGCGVTPVMMGTILRDTLADAGISIDGTADFPVIIRKGVNALGREIVYYLNYSGQTQSVPYYGAEAGELLSGETVRDGDVLEIAPWDLKILERPCEPIQ